MNVKRYYGANMAEVMIKIRTELGPDAVILSSRSVRSQKGLRKLFSKPVIEVMVAFEEAVPHNTSTLAASVANQGFAARLNQTLTQRPPAPQEDELWLADTQEELEVHLTDVLVGDDGPQDLLPPEEITQEQLAPPMPDFIAQEPVQREDLQNELVIENTQRIHDKQEEMERKLDRMGELLDHVAKRMESMNVTLPAETTMYIAEMQPLLAALMDAEIHIDLIHAIAQESERVLSRMNLRPEAVVRRVISQYLGAVSPINLTRGRQRIVLLIGPTGVGKTTSLVKLAAQFSLQQKAKVGFINADTFRIGAKEQIATYAEILGAPLNVVYSIEEIPAAIAQQQDRDIIFIDMAGKKPSDVQNKDDIQRVITLCKPDEIFLVLSATTGNRASREIIRHYSFVREYKLIITKIDETSSAGIVLNACYFSGAAVSYLSWGQNVPDDIAPANLEAIVESLLGGGNPW